MGSRKALEERLQREQAELLRRHLAELRDSQRGGARTLPPQPSCDDRARYASASRSERERAAVLLQGAGFSRTDIDRGEKLLPTGKPVDDVTRARSRVLLWGRR